MPLSSENASKIAMQSPFWLASKEYSSFMDGESSVRRVLILGRRIAEQVSALKRLPEENNEAHYCQLMGELVSPVSKEIGRLDN